MSGKYEPWRDWDARQAASERENAPGRDWQGRAEAAPGEAPQMHGPGSAGMGEEVLEVRPGPGTVVVDEDELRERMDAESPDGRPPDLKHQRQARALFLVLWIVPVAVVALLAYYAGWQPAVLAVLFMLVFIGIAAWPTWHAALDRKIDSERVKREVAQEHTPRDDG